MAVGRVDSWVKNYDKRDLVPFPACASFTNEYCSGSLKISSSVVVSSVKGAPQQWSCCQLVLRVYSSASHPTAVWDSKCLAVNNAIFFASFLDVLKANLRPDVFAAVICFPFLVINAYLNNY